MDDSDVANAIYLAKKLQVVIHIRGTDEKPIVEFTDKFTKTIVGGIELKRRMAKLKELENGQ